MTSRRGLYPLKFVECIRRYGFGGRRIPEYFGKSLAEGIIAETWEITDHGADVSTVRNGQLAGRTLRELIGVNRSALLGTRVAASSPNRFPLLLKFLDAQRTLTMQVHPDDAYAAVNEPGETGKTEAWYIVQAEPGATLYCGSVPGLTRLALEQAIAEGHPERCMVEIPVEAGDVLYVPAGRMHAIGQGILLFEAQQSCDLTYVPYPRPTDDRETGRRRVEKFVEATHLEDLGEQRIPSVGLCRGSSERRLLLANRYFAMDLLRLGDAWHLHLDGTRFLACSVLAGAGRVESTASPTAFAPEPFCRGESFLLPASLGPCALVPDLECEVLVSYVPDLLADVVEPLRQLGVPPGAIAALGGPGAANDLAPFLVSA